MKKTTIFLSISILLNIFLVGYIASNKFLHKRHHHKKDFKHEFVSKELKADLKTKRNELFEIVSAAEFDESLYDAKIEEIKAIHNQIQNRMPKKLKDKIIGKNQAERIKLVERIKAKHKH